MQIRAIRYPTSDGAATDCPTVTVRVGSRQRRETALSTNIVVGAQPLFDEKSIHFISCLWNRRNQFHYNIRVHC